MPNTYETAGVHPDSLVGIGLYSLAEAGRLVKVDATKIGRWLRGHEANGIRYEPLWKPQIDLGDDGVFLGFRDLQEIRVAAAFIEAGLSSQRVRQTIAIAQSIVSDERPLSTMRFKTDGRTVFLQIVEQDGEPRLLDLFRKQFAFNAIIERSLTNVEFDSDGVPSKWWPLGRTAKVVVDPTRSFGQPIEVETSIPTSVMAQAVKAEGSEEAAARAWSVPVRAVRRAVTFEAGMAGRRAA